MAKEREDELALAQLQIEDLQRQLAAKDAEHAASIQAALSDAGGTRAGGTDKVAGKGPFWDFECECPKLATQCNAITREDKLKCGAIKVIKAGDESDAKRLFCIRTLVKGRSLDPSEWTVTVKGLQDRERFERAARVKHKRMVDSGMWPETAKLPVIRGVPVPV